MDGLSAERFFKDEKADDHARSLPAGFTESAVSCDAASKPVALFALLERERAVCRLIIVFCNSVDTVTRLAHLAQLWCVRRQWLGGEECVLALSSAAGAARRDAIIKECRRRLDEDDMPCTVLVASDALARGVDLPSVSLVINYDAPRDASNYVHRVGRAARAGRDRPRNYTDQKGPGQGLRPRAAQGRAAHEGAARVRRCAELLHSRLQVLPERLGGAARHGRKLRQPAGGFGRGFLNAPGSLAVLVLLQCAGAGAAVAVAVEFVVVGVPAGVPRLNVLFVGLRV